MLVTVILLFIIFIGYQTVVKHRTIEEAGDMVSKVIDGIKLSSHQEETKIKSIENDAFKEAREYFNRASDYSKSLDNNDKKKAFSLYEKSAKIGFPEAQFELSNCYLKGDGVASNINKARYWLNKAAKQGNTKAIITLAMFNSSTGTPEEKNKAINLIKETANSGLPYAQYILSMMYLSGESIEKNIEKSFFWAQKSANSGYLEAQNLVGLMYEQGIGTNKNIKNALKWYEKSAKQGSVVAHKNRTRVIVNFMKESGRSMANPSMPVPNSDNL